MKCQACDKMYSSAYNLGKHHKRQPLCLEWIRLQPGIKDFIDDKFQLPLNDLETSELDTKCFVCNTVFSNVGNLNRHLDTHVICSKWSMYKDLEPLQAYNKTTDCASEFVAPKHKLCHIIWNIFLIDKELQTITEIIKENNIQYIIGIFPDEETYGNVFPPGIDHHVMLYHGHTIDIDIKMFDEQCAKIEEHRKNRGNIFVCCNSGYQRSIPFLCYYFVKYHPNEVPSVAKAIDLILPQVDKANYASMRDMYVFSTELLLQTHLEKKWNGIVA